MSDEKTIEGMRYELGRESAQKGDPLHEGASEEFYHGYTDARPTAWAGSSNVMPRLFGKGRVVREDPWDCVCGERNRHYYPRCQMCGISYSLAKEALSE